MDSMFDEEDEVTCGAGCARYYVTFADLNSTSFTPSLQ